MPGRSRRSPSSSTWRRPSASALELAAPAIERAGLRLETDVPATLPARADPDRLAQVLANLLSNAVRYTPAGGTVTVRAERRPGDLLVSVANTGEGIPPDDLDRVFERFYRVEKSRDRARGGAGIGLAIVKQLVEQGGGRVGAESRDGLTRFWFSVPACRRQGRPIATMPARTPARPTHWTGLQSLAQERDRDDDRDRRTERRGQADEPRLGVLEAVREDDAGPSTSRTPASATSRRPAGRRVRRSPPSSPMQQRARRSAAPTVMASDEDERRTGRHWPCATRAGSRSRSRGR